MKDLKIEGRHKLVKDKRDLEGFVHPDWNDLDEVGRTRWQNERQDALLGQHDVSQTLELLDTALDMRKGHLPAEEHAQWKGILGFDDVAKTVAAVPALTTATNPQLARASAAAAARPASPRSFANRPERSGRKRRYDESSYTGYHEGYEDDGYSTGGTNDANRRGSGGKRQKRKVSAKSIRTEE